MKNKVVHVFTEQDVGMTPGFPLKIVKDRQMQSVPYHSHNFIELAFVAEGCALHSYTGPATRASFREISFPSWKAKATSSGRGGTWCSTTSICTEVCSRRIRN